MDPRTHPRPDRGAAAVEGALLISFLLIPLLMGVLTYGDYFWRAQRVGEYVELPSTAACCGAAGSYSVVRPKDSARVLDRHLDEIADADLDIIAVVNPGCYRQLQQGVKRRGLRTRVLHLAELLADEK